MNGYPPQGQFPGQFPEQFPGQPGSGGQPQGGWNPQPPTGGGMPPYFPSSPRIQATGSKKSKWWIWFLVAILVLVGVVGGLIAYLVRTPQYSLYKMFRAAARKDTEEVFKYFNVDAIVDDIFERTIQEEKEKYSSVYSEEELSQFEAAAKSEFNTYKEIAKKEMKKQIEEGKFFLGEDYKNISLLKAFQEVKTKKLSNGDVNITVKDKEGREITMTMRKKDGYWEIYKYDMTLEELMKLWNIQ